MPSKQDLLELLGQVVRMRLAPALRRADVAHSVFVKIMMVENARSNEQEM